MHGIGPDDMHIAAVEAQFLHCALHGQAFRVAFDLGIKGCRIEIAIAHIGLDLHQIQAIGGKTAQSLIEGGRQAAHLKDKAGEAGFRGLWQLVGIRRIGWRHQDKTRRVVLGIRNIVGQDLQAIDLARNTGGNGRLGWVGLATHPLGGRGGITCDMRRPAMILDSLAALGQGVNVAVHICDLV
jgi:hypothetical protein